MGPQRSSASSLRICLVNGCGGLPSASLPARRLPGGQPAMANLRNLARELSGGDPETIHVWLERPVASPFGTRPRFATSARSLFQGCLTVLTISRSSAVAAVLLGAWRRGWRGETVVFDGSPAGCGADQVSGSPRLWMVFVRSRTRPCRHGSMDQDLRSYRRRCSQPQKIGQCHRNGDSARTRGSRVHRRDSSPTRPRISRTMRSTKSSPRVPWWMKGVGSSLAALRGGTG